MNKPTPFFIALLCALGAPALSAQQNPNPPQQAQPAAQQGTPTPDASLVTPADPSAPAQLVPPPCPSAAQKSAVAGFHIPGWLKQRIDAERAKLQSKSGLDIPDPEDLIKRPAKPCPAQNPAAVATPAATQDAQ